MWHTLLESRKTMVFRHTYWMAASETAAGELRDNEHVVRELENLYRSKQGGVEAKSTVMDGASVWLTEARELELRCVVGGVSTRVTEEAITKQFSQWMLAE